VDQAGVALPAPVVPETDLAGDLGGDRAAGVVDEASRVEICRRVGEDGASVTAVAREFGVGWCTARVAVREHGTPRVDDSTRRHRSPRAG
jgi:hypothetical protein